MSQERHPPQSAAPHRAALDHPDYRRTPYRRPPPTVALCCRQLWWITSTPTAPNPEPSAPSFRNSTPIPANPSPTGLTPPSRRSKGEPGHGKKSSASSTSPVRIRLPAPRHPGHQLRRADSSDSATTKEAPCPDRWATSPLAGHRQTRGKVLNDIDLLTEGDHIYVRTKDGYYTYTVYSHEIKTRPGRSHRGRPRTAR